MPIYAYRCASCGHTKDVLQKISDAPLTVCPACGASAFAKQVTAAGFQLKGSGWYATDFKGGGTKKPADGTKTDDAKTDGAKTEAGKSEVGKTEAGKSGDSSAPAKSGDGGTSGTSSTADSSGPKAAGCGGACACH
jgi:putative FmdB family regulatory protein